MHKVYWMTRGTKIPNFLYKCFFSLIFVAQSRKTVEKVIQQKENRVHRTSKIIKSTQRYRSGHQHYYRQYLPDISSFPSSPKHKATTCSIYWRPATSVSNTHHATTSFTSTPFHSFSSSHSSSPSPSPSSSPSSFSPPSSTSSSPQFSPYSSAPVASTTSSDWQIPSVVSHEEFSASDCQDTPSSSIDYGQLSTVSTYQTPVFSYAECYFGTSYYQSSFSGDGYPSVIVPVLDTRKATNITV